MRSPVAAGASFILLDEAVTAADMTGDDIGLLLNWRYGPAGESIDDLAFVTQAHAFTGLGLRPYSPVHLQGKRDPATGDWTFVWVRRTRIGGDSWEAAEVPLSEASELYTLEILDAPGGDVLRTITGLGAQAYLYSAADQVTDFGSTQFNVAIRVTQISATLRRGGAGRSADLRLSALVSAPPLYRPLACLRAAGTRRIVRCQPFSNSRRAGSAGTRPTAASCSGTARPGAISRTRQGW